MLVLMLAEDMLADSDARAVTLPPRYQASRDDAQVFDAARLDMHRMAAEAMPYGRAHRAGAVGF